MISGERRSIQVLKILVEHSYQCNAGCAEWCGTDKPDAVLCEVGRSLLDEANNFIHLERLADVSVDSIMKGESEVALAAVASL